MIAPTPTLLVHHYDTRLRRIGCGLHGPDHRSTKHSRAVTCPACVALLPGKSAAAPAAAGGLGPAAVR